MLASVASVKWNAT